MATKPKSCARSGGSTVAACHYVWCRKNKACVERPENAKRIIELMHKAEGAPSHAKGKAKARRK